MYDMVQLKDLPLNGRLKKKEIIKHFQLELMPLIVPKVDFIKQNELLLQKWRKKERFKATRRRDPSSETFFGGSPRTLNLFFSLSVLFFKVLLLNNCTKTSIV